VQDHRFGDAVQRQVAAQVDALAGPDGAPADEGHGGELREVEEVRALQVRIAGGLTRIDGGDVDAGLDHGRGRVGFVEDHLPVSFLKLPRTLLTIR